MSKEFTSNAEMAGRVARRNTLLLVLAGLVACSAVAFCSYWFLFAVHFVSTDNAYTGVEVAQVTPSVGGTVGEVRVTDTQAVKQGDILVVIDPTDARFALEQAEADLQRAIRRVNGYVANDAGLKSQISAREAEEIRASAQFAAAEADLERARIDAERRRTLMASGSVSADELTRAENALATAVANLDAARAGTAQAQANRLSAVGNRATNASLIVDSTVDENPEVLQAKARRDQAKVDLERTIVKSPVDGVIAKRTVQLGQRVQPGTPLLAVVPVHAMHVDANFKEGELMKVRVGQSVTLAADIYGSSVKYHGTVEGFSGGSGAAFSAIPAQNATGNWIKVVQRLPVRIKLDAKELEAHPLKVGLSMSAEIDTRENS